MAAVPVRSVVTISLPEVASTATIDDGHCPPADAPYTLMNAAPPRFPPAPIDLMNQLTAAIATTRRLLPRMQPGPLLTLRTSAALLVIWLSPNGPQTNLHAQSVAPESIAADEQSAEDNLLRRMTTAGITLSDDVSYTLPEPTFVSITGEPVASAVAQQSLTRIAGPQGVSRFTRDSVVAPLAVRTEAIADGGGKRIGHFIDVTFVVHQSIAEIRQSKVLDNFRSAAAGDSKVGTIKFPDNENADELETTMTRSLTASELSQFGVSLDQKYESLGYLQLPLLGKVILSGVARARRSVWSTEDESAPVILTWLLDSRFGSASPQADSIANQWRAIQRNEVGQRELGPPQPYAGMGGYVAIAPLPGDAAASIVQIRFVIHEPQDWFQGRNLLRSKLPLLIQDRVRNIRRELQD